MPNQMSASLTRDAFAGANSKMPPWTLNDLDI